MIKIGDKIPSVTLAATGDSVFKPYDHKGHPLILYFYPKGQHTRLHERGPGLS